MTVASGGLGAPTALRCEFLTNPIGVGEGRPRLSWLVTDGRRGAAQAAYRIVVASSLEVLGRDEGDVWDSGTVKSSQSVLVEYAGRALASRERCYWKVKTIGALGDESPWSEAAFWEMGLMAASDWSASWISLEPNDLDRNPRPARYFRRSFVASGRITRARVYATARGIYELSVNGAPVSADLFRPGWTDYTKRYQYQAYDITALMRAGANVVGAVLGEGWYCGRMAWGTKRNLYGDRPQMLAQLELTYEDGQRETISTDASWTVSLGPIVESGFLLGETYDARVRIDGWDESGFDDGLWASARAEALDGTPLVATPNETVKRIQEICPTALSEPQPRVHIFDLGQNMVGRVRVKVVAPEGTRVTIRHGEMLNPDGTLYVTNLRSAKSTDVYICSGAGVEIYEPVFTFHGFRYVELTGFPGRPGNDAVTGVVLHSATPATGTFECSSRMINQLQHNIEWGQRGNFVEVPTDCPQRDERLGWMGDAQVFARTACFNMDVAAFFTKWHQDVRDAQHDDGAFSDVSPDPVLGGGGVAAWGDAGVICPWVTYLCYGDKRGLEHHYPAMQRWIAYLRNKSEKLIRSDTGYGDWLSTDADTPRDLIGTAYFAYSTSLVARVAAVLGKAQDAAEYTTLFGEIRDAFCREYATPAGRVVAGTQTAYGLALGFDLLPEEIRGVACEHLVRDIRKRDMHLSTGFVGTPLVLHVLTRFAHMDVAYDLLNQDTFPSWGYPIKHGSTTMWERWDGWRHDKGFQDAGMNSFNHYAYGAVGEWMYANVAGIDLDSAEPAFKHVVVRPRPGGGITSAKASLESPYGRIATEWRIADGVMTLEVTVPANAHATVHVPAKDPSAVTEGGAAIAHAEGIGRVRSEEGALVCEIGAGRYSFRSTIG
jgi:alpha-L-rhamnosidase